MTRYLLSNKKYNRRRLRPTKIHTDKVVECQWKKLGLPWLCMCVVWHAQGRQKWPQNTGFSKLNRKFFKVFLWYQLIIATRFWQMFLFHWSDRFLSQIINVSSAECRIILFLVYGWKNLGWPFLIGCSQVCPGNIKICPWEKQENRGFTFITQSNCICKKTVQIRENKTK